MSKRSRNDPADHEAKDPETQALSALGRQTDDIITADTEWPDLAGELTVSEYEREDTYYNSDAAIPFRPMFLSYLYALVESKSLTTMPEHLEDNPELAESFGFAENDLPSETSFSPGRMETRFSDLESELRTGAREIVQLARDVGSPIGNTLTDVNEHQPDDDPSKRTINRLLRSNCVDVLDELEESGFFSLDLPRTEEAIYDSTDLLTLETIAALRSDAAHDAGKTMGDMMNPDPDISDDLFYEDGPSGEVLLNAIKTMSIDEITTQINESLKKTYTRAKPKLHELNKSANVRLAIDVTYVAYYGDHGVEWVVGAPDDKNYQWCWKFATATIVGENAHYVVGVEPLGSPQYTDNASYPDNTKKNYRQGAIVRRLLDRATEHVDIRVVYADRAFYGADVLTTLEDRGLFYVIPAPARERLKRKKESFDALKSGFEDHDDDIPIYVEHDYAIYGGVKGKTTSTRVETNLVLLPPDRDVDVKGPQPFVTNLAVDDQIRLDRVSTVEKIERYSYRGGIETSYKSIKECAAWTSSKEIEVRWFHFGFACVIYNMWLLVDFLTQVRIGVIETATDPRITLSRFLGALERKLQRRVGIE
jgi:hypothetical protein